MSPVRNFTRAGLYIFSNWALGGYKRTTQCPVQSLVCRYVLLAEPRMYILLGIKAKLSVLCRAFYVCMYVLLAELRMYVSLGIQAKLSVLCRANIYIIYIYIYIYIYITKAYIVIVCKDTCTIKPRWNQTLYHVHNHQGADLTQNTIYIYIYTHTHTHTHKCFTVLPSGMRDFTA